MKSKQGISPLFYFSIWFFRMKLTTFPSSCVRYQGEPVAFEILHPYGQLNHQFVIKEHRRKGLGNIVEQDLARKLIRFSIFPRRLNKI